MATRSIARYTMIGAVIAERHGFVFVHDRPHRMQTYQVTGIHCASCVVKIEKALRGVPGVTKASVNFATETASVEGDVPTETRAAAVAKVGGYKLEPID